MIYSFKIVKPSKKIFESCLTYPSYGLVEGALVVVGGFLAFGIVGDAKLLELWMSKAINEERAYIWLSIK